MANARTARAASANKAAKKRTKKTRCLTCGCDAKLPEDEATRKVALTAYAESTPNEEEMTAVVSTMHNRVGAPGYGNAKSVDQVLSKKTGKGVYEYNGYQSPKYKKAEQNTDNLNQGECAALKKAIAAAEKVQKEGVPAEYKGYKSFLSQDYAQKNGFTGGTQIGGTRFWSGLPTR